MRKKRTERVRFGGLKRKLNLDSATEKRIKADNLVPRFINDSDHGQRLRDAEAGGYKFIEAEGTEKVGDAEELQERDRRIRRLVGTNKDGSPQYAYLMGIPKEFYDEDQAEKEKENLKVDEAIRGGNPKGLKHHGIPRSQGDTYVKNVNYKP